ncbi:MAG TPA: BamA/TamA family outer membrane protein [Candidatus Eisenbacteria bacterium]|nr:BamA/TamA family outer membrane protein [Candidatus Eisenbacteria bacterium]
MRNAALWRGAALFLTAAPFLLLLHAAPARAAGPNADPADTTQALLTREILSTKRTQINAYPYLYYTPETELAFGVGGITTFYTSREDAILRPSKIALSGYYATTGQYKFSLNPQLYFGANKTIVTANLDYGHYVDKFWGIGPDTPDLEDAAAFESKGFGAEITLLVPPKLKVFNRTSAGFVFDLYNSDIVDKRQNPELQSGDVRGSEGGVSTGLGWSWNWDTRDKVFYPTKGGYHQLKGIYYGQWLGGSFDFNKYEIDLRHYQQIKPQHIVALQVFAQTVGGTPPFYELPALGGQRIMRGYYQGRYRDESLLAGQVEYRTHIYKRIGAVGFAGIGDVGTRLRDIKIRDLKTSLGVGARFLFNKAENVNLRADIGFGRETSGVYFGLEEAF